MDGSSVSVCTFVLAFLDIWGVIYLFNIDMIIIACILFVNLTEPWMVPPREHLIQKLWVLLLRWSESLMTSDDEPERDPNCMGALLTCVESFFPDDYDKQNVACNHELLKYKGMEGIFGRRLAISGRSKNDDSFNHGNYVMHFKCHFFLFKLYSYFYFLISVSWWSNYGSKTPNLQFMAMKILSLTTNSSGCERNWSTFEGYSK